MKMYSGDVATAAGGVDMLLKALASPHGHEALRGILRGASAARFEPVLLAALAAMIGAAAILLGPIFRGLGISLVFASSTLLIVLMIPAVSVALHDTDTVPVPFPTGRDEAVTAASATTS